MRIIKNTKGITLISLVITIIIIIILASVATYSGIKVVNSSKLAAFTTELKIMQTQVNKLYDERTNDEETIDGLGKEISTVQTQADKVFTAIVNEIDNREGYRYYDQETIKNLGIEGVEGEFFVNVSKRSVVSYEGLKYEGNTYYTLNQLPDSLYNVEYSNENIGVRKPNFELDVEKLNNGEYKISAKNISYDGNIKKWNLQYRLDGEKEFTESKDLNIRLSEEGLYYFKIANGNIKSDEQSVTLRNAKNNDYIKNHIEDYYGHYVTNYNSPNDAGINADQDKKWQIFMVDDDNIYLIASNYITKQYTGMKNNVGFDYDTEKYTEATAINMWFTSIKDQYNANSTTTDIPGILSKLDKQTTYHKWMNTPENQTKNYINERSVASMLDVDVWSGYNNTTYAKYAIGGPTIEMFCKSYNDSHTGEQLEAQYTNNTTGYKIKKGRADPSTEVKELRTGAKNTLVDDMCFNSYTEANYCWLASPAASGNSDLIRVIPKGQLGRNYYNSIFPGFRPLVCLKSELTLVLNEDGETYSIL